MSDTPLRIWAVLCDPPALYRNEATARNFAHQFFGDKEVIPLVDEREAIADRQYAMELRALLQLSLPEIGFMPASASGIAHQCELRDDIAAALAKNPSPVGPTSDAAPSGATGGNEGAGTSFPAPSGPVGLGPNDEHLTMDIPK